MGLSYVAQETLPLRVLAEAGLREEAVILTDGAASSDLSETFSLATDDVMTFSDRWPRGTVAATERLKKQFVAHATGITPEPFRGHHENVMDDIFYFLDGATFPPNWLIK